MRLWLAILKHMTNQRSNKILSLLLPLLNPNVFELIALAWRLGRRVLSITLHEGMYEVLDYEAQLELLDARGAKAILHKRQQVRFLQDNIIAYQDQAWGDGNIFADYQSAPGVAVDRYREGHRYRILISLRQTKNRGDTEEFHIERAITDGFTHEVEDFQIEVDHKTQRLSFCVIFPKKRPPRRAWLIEQNTTRTFLLGAETIQTLPDGRKHILWKTDKPRVFEAYILRWEW